MSREIKNLHRDYLEDMMYFYGANGNRVRKGKSGSNVRCIEPIDAMAKFYASESPIVRAWTTESEFKDKLKEAKRKQRY